MLDHKFEPSLLEVNQMPSFATDFPLDIKIKQGLIVNCLRKLCLNIPRKRRYKTEMKARIDERSGLVNKADVLA